MTIQLPSAEERDASDLKPAGPIIIAGIAGLTIEEAFGASTEAENESRHKISSPKERKDTSSPLASSNALATHAQSLVSHYHRSFFVSS